MGFFIGATIHDVAQVVGAGYSVSPETGDLATFVKLLRVAMLVPIVMAIALVCRISSRAQEASQSSPVSFPIFLLGFIALFVLNNTVPLPETLTEGLSHLATALLLLAVTALGVRTSLREVASIGWRPIILLGGETLFLAATIVGLLLLGSSEFRGGRSARMSISNCITFSLYWLNASLRDRIKPHFSRITRSGLAMIS